MHSWLESRGSLGLKKWLTYFGKKGAASLIIVLSSYFHSKLDANLLIKQHIYPPTVNSSSLISI
jgi:hypothetical protein